MRVYLDDESVAVEPATVARAIEVARELAEGRGRMVIEVTGDGAAVPDEVLGEPPHTDGGYGELRLTSADPSSFIGVTLLDVADALEAAKVDQDAAAEAFQTGETETAHERLREALMVWEIARDVVQKAGALLGVDPGTVSFAVEGETVGGQACIDSLRAALERLRAAVSDNATTDIADLAEYDLAEEIVRWKAFLSAMAGLARGVTASS